jgi:hypothetical protein
MSVKSRHFLLRFYKISIPICGFLLAFLNLNDVAAVEVRSSSWQPPSHGFLDCLASLVVVTFQVIFQWTKQVVVWGGGVNSVTRMDGRATPSPSFELSSRSYFPLSQNLHHLLDRMVPHSKLRCSFSDCYPSVFSDELIDLCLLLSFAAVLSRPQRG